MPISNLQSVYYPKEVQTKTFNIILSFSTAVDGTNITVENLISNDTNTGVKLNKEANNPNGESSHLWIVTIIPPDNNNGQLNFEIDNDDDDDIDIEFTVYYDTKFQSVFYRLHYSNKNILEEVEKIVIDNSGENNSTALTFTRGTEIEKVLLNNNVSLDFSSDNNKKYHFYLSLTDLENTHLPNDINFNLRIGITTPDRKKFERTCKNTETSIEQYLDDGKGHFLSDRLINSDGNPSFEISELPINSKIARLLILEEQLIINHRESGFSQLPPLTEDRGSGVSESLDNTATRYQGLAEQQKRKVNLHAKYWNLFQTRQLEYFYEHDHTKRFGFGFSENYAEFPDRIYAAIFENLELQITPSTSYTGAGYDLTIVVKEQ